MLYFNTPIHESTASAIFVPVSVDAVIKPGTLHWEMADRLPEEFRRGYYRECRDERLVRGRATVFIPDIGPWKDRAVLTAPGLQSTSKLITVMDAMRGIARAARLCRLMDIPTLAIGHPCPDLASWETMEDLIIQFEEEELEQDGRVELWLYPPEEDESEVEVEEARQRLMEIGVTS